MKQRRHNYKRKRSLYRKSKTKIKSQLAWEEETRTHSIRYYFIMGILSLVLLIGSFNNSNDGIALTLFIMLLVLLIILVENEMYSLHKTENQSGKVLNQKIVLSVLAVKEIMISAILLFIIFLTTVIILDFFQIPLNDRYRFNTLFIFIFLLTLLFYFLYSRYELDRFFFRKTAKKEKAEMERLKKEDYQEFFLNVTDFFAIFATIVLLTNSTASLIYPAEIKGINNLIGTFEFNLFLCVLANYVPAIYHRLPH